MPEERWLPVPDWPGYEVSDHGRARSVPRLLGDGRRHGGQMLRQHPDRKGYPVVTLTEGGQASGGRRRTVRVHVLVMLAFAGPPPAGKPQVRHLNGANTDNCWPRNLAYGDQADQEADKARHRASGRRPDGVNRRKGKRETRSEEGNSSRAPAIVASPASAPPQGTLPPGQTLVSSQVATAAATSRATGCAAGRRP